MKRVVGAVALILAAGFAVVPLLAARADAHSGTQSYVYLDIYESSIEGRLEFPIKELNRELSLSIPQDEENAGPQIEANVAALQQYPRDHFTIGNSTEVWPYEFTELEFLEVDAGSYAVMHFQVSGAREVPAGLTVRFDPFVDTNSDHSSLLLIGNYWKGGVFGNEADHLIVYNKGARTQSFSLEDPSFWKGFRGVTSLGTEHIRSGPDHILFIIALLLPSVLVLRAKQWTPSPSFKASLKRIVKIATMFTLAHSITLSLAALDIVRLPSRPVETVIALSIAAAALNNIWPVVVNREWAVAFAFGLFHGMGFAGLLSQLGLDRSNRVWSLLGFNLGIEIGQVAIVLAVFPILYVLRRLLLYRNFVQLGSLGLTVVALAWAVERAFETDLKVDRLVDPIFVYPRVLVVVAACAAIAVVLYLIESHRDRLSPIVLDQ